MKSIFLFIFILRITLSFGQSICDENIERASKYINKGRINEAIELVRPCSKESDGNSRWQAFRILSIAFILQEQRDSARYFASMMLELNPLYKPDQLNDPKDFILILNKINIIPKFSLGLAFMYGGNITFPEITGTYAPVNYSKNYNSKEGYQVGLVCGYNFNKHNGIDLNLTYNSKKYGLTYNTFGSRVNIEETFNTLDFILLYRRIFFAQKRLRFNVTAGAYSSILLTSFNDLTIKDSSSQKDVAHYSSKVRRNPFNYGIVAGAGLIYKLGNGHISSDVRFFKGLSNITASENRYDNSMLIYDYSYIDDDIILHSLSLSIGYHLYINYKISK